MSEIVIVTDKKHKLRMYSWNEQFWHREQGTVYGLSVWLYTLFIFPFPTDNIIFLITFDEGVNAFTFVCLFLCLSVKKITGKSRGPNFIKLISWMRHGPRINQLDFGTNLDLDMDPGSIFHLSNTWTGCF